MNRLVFAAAAAISLGTALPAAAQFQKPEDAIKYRKSAMTVMANHFGRIGAMVNGRVPFDAATVQANADVVATLSKLPFTGFIDGTSTGDTKAKPEIWTDFADFTAKMKDLERESAALATIAKSGDEAKMREQFAKTGGACKACHDKYKAE